MVEGAHKIWKRPNTLFYTDVTVNEIGNDSFYHTGSEGSKGSKVARMCKVTLE